MGNKTTQRQTKQARTQRNENLRDKISQNCLTSYGKPRHKKTRPMGLGNPRGQSPRGPGDSRRSLATLGDVQGLTGACFHFGSAKAEAPPCISKAPKRRRGFAFLKRPSEGALCISKAPKWRRVLHFLSAQVEARFAFLKRPSGGTALHLLGAQAEAQALTKKSETKASNTNSQGNKKIPCSEREHFRSRRRKVLKFVGLPQN